MIQNDLLLRTLAGKETERPPVWLMRQAGRILPEYRAIRSSLSGFKELVSTPDLAAEVTVQPVDILGVDAAIIFSDILVIPECMGLDYTMVEKVGPRFPETIGTEADVDRLISGPDAAERLQYVFDAIHATKKLLDNRVPLIGFSGAPWTLLAYMVEGGGSKTFSTAKSLLYREPALAHKLLNRITDTVIAYLKLKIESGVDVVQLFDSWSGILSQSLYRTFGLPYIERICDAIKDQTPTIVFSKGAWFALRDIKKIDGVTVGLDWQTEPELARDIFGKHRVLQGNLDPSCLLSTPQVIESDTTNMLQRFGGHHVANLGHGVYPNTPVEHVKAFINTVKSYRY